MEGFRSGFVAMIGRTNVGKSTLMNRLIGQKVAITSNKPQTTRTRIRTILTEERGQAIFVDTPGIHKSQNKLGDYMVGVAERTLKEVDVILWLVEPTDHIGAGDRHIADLLAENDTPKVLVINKTDRIPKEKVLAMIAMYKDLADFSEVVPISALNGYNEEELKKVIFKLLPEGPMYYEEDELTDQPERQIVAEIIREQALNCLSDEVPHGLAINIDLMKERPVKDGPVILSEDGYTGSGFFDIDATIICERDSHKGIVIGKQGAMLKKIGTRARQEMEAVLGFRCNLKLFVKVKKDWRDSESLLRNYGFRDEDDD